MVLDIEYFRESDDPDAIGPAQLREAQKKRFKDPEIIDKVIAADEAWRQCLFKVECLKQLKTASSKTCGEKMKAKEALGEKTVPDGATEGLLELAMKKAGASAIKEKLKEFTPGQLQSIVAEIKKMTDGIAQETDTHLQEREKWRRLVGNILHPDTPIFKDEEHNKAVRTIGPVGSGTERKYTHPDLIVMIDAVDIERGTMVSGNRGYFMRGPGVALEQALVAYAHEFLMSRDYTFLSPPVFMKKEVMQEVAQLSQFAEELYKVVGKASEVEGDETIDEKFLIATGEQPIAAYHRKEALHPKDLPKWYAGISECFRQEVGSHGRDTKGIFRVHQFKKIEQFVVTAPDESWKAFEVMIKNAEDFTQSLGLSYQVVDIVSGDLNLAAARKYDLEAWFPGQQKFRELVSCSNCTDYQSRRLEIKYGQSQGLMDKRATYVHMLNSTLCATTRVICCILESFQVGDAETGGGIVVPEVLRKYMPAKYKEFIPFVKPKPLTPEEEAARKKGASGGGKKKGAGKKSGGK